MVLKLAKILAAVLLVAGAFFLGATLNPKERRVVSTVNYEPIECNCSPNCRVSGENGLYLDLMKLSVTDLAYETDGASRAAISAGRNWPTRGLTMVGTRRLDNVQTLMEKALSENTPGDFLEAGSWRGGACLFMRAVLEAHGIKDRVVWVADSFEGLPPHEKYTAERSMAVSLEEVQASFSRYGLLDDQVKFLKGWFKDTLAQAPIKALAVLRSDADLYQSTMDSLVPLYDKVSPGGYVIIDDYSSFPDCARAVDDFRKAKGISAPLTKVDWTAVYWQKPKAPDPKSGTKS